MWMFLTKKGSAKKRKDKEKGKNETEGNEGNKSMGICIK